MVGIETDLDPSLSRRDSLAGSLVVKEDNMPQLKNRISIDYSQIPDKFNKPLQKGEVVLINVLASKVLGTIVSQIQNKVIINLGDTFLPYFPEDQAIISRKLNNVWTLAGAGKIYE